jgi:hypothetical protein
MKVRRSFLGWCSSEYHFRVKHQNVSVWNGTKYVWNEKHKSQYMHYWKSRCWPPLIEYRDAPTLLGGTRMMVPGVSLGDGVLHITIR